jgi:hypothetical protein
MPNEFEYYKRKKTVSMSQLKQMFLFFLLAVFFFGEHEKRKTEIEILFAQEKPQKLNILIGFSYRSFYVIRLVVAITLNYRFNLYLTRWRDHKRPKR